MSVKRCMEELALINAQYSKLDDKNYYLIQKTMQSILLLTDYDIKVLRSKILEEYNYKDFSSFCDYACVMSKQSAYNKEMFPHNAQEEIECSGNILDFYSSYDENLIRYIKGHLFLEFAMNTIIEKALKLSTKNKTFANKITLLYKNNLISEDEKNLLKAINKVRNEIAHNLNYILTFDCVYNLVVLSSKARVDYSDDTIHENKKLSLEWYGVDGIVSELFPNTFCHLFYNNENFFEGNEILNYIS